MLSPTLREGLKAYGIGPKIRSIRLKKKMGLVELGRHSGLSPAMLSKIERGQLFPTLPTLLRIAMVFSVGLDYFIGDEQHTLEARDSTYFDATVPHAYRKPGVKSCCAIVVTAG
jgi:transcriptional regulator with XRE-family HTH domain